VHDYTRRMIERPQDFGMEYLLRPGSRGHRLAVLGARHLYWLCPTYIWLLEKPAGSATERLMPPLSAGRRRPGRSAPS
jgi:hypothetical protein